MTSTPGKLVISAAVWVAAIIALCSAAQADPGDDPGDVQQLQPPRPSAAALVEQIPGMHIINTAITDNGVRMVCAHLDSHSREDTPTDLLHDNPTFTPAEADAFVSDAEQVYCPSHIRQAIG